MTQSNPVGAQSKTGELLLGSLMHSAADDAENVLDLVEDADLDPPLDEILSAIRRVVRRGAPPSPELVADELRRVGRFDATLGYRLAAAATSGACRTAARHLAAAVVAESLRRRTESFGRAIQLAAQTGAEPELIPLVDRAVVDLKCAAARLASLRGGAA